jgi:protein-L-isoaspartate(D-aspartate) O-methyltransferase
VLRRVAVHESGRDAGHLPCANSIQPNAEMMDYAAARLNMVESQVRPNRVTDTRIVMAMLELPREKFLPDSLRGVAYVDEDVHIGNGRYLTEPMVLARLLQAAAIGAADTVLEIGTGTGYGAAVMARLAGKVIALESDPALVKKANAVLNELAVKNVTVVEGALAQGCPKYAPYNAIVFSGGVEYLPEAAIDQLAEGGRLLAVLAPPGEASRATLTRRIGGAISTRAIFDAASPILPGLKREAGFVF